MATVIDKVSNPFTVSVNAADLSAAVATATAAAASATTSGNLAVTSAAAAAVSADRATTAWAASTAPAEAIAGKSQILHQGTIVASCIDLPSKHSDGGAWIDRCQDKSWYNETLGGDRWIGWQATIAAAWTAAGSATGAVFGASATAGPLTIGKFYTATSATTASEVFRGIKREYPRAGVAWIAESGRVVGYDLGSGAMWMVFVNSSSGYLLAGGTQTCIAAGNGQLLVGTAVYGLHTADFLKDSGSRRNDAGTRTFRSGIANRNANYMDASANAVHVLVNANINSVALTVLPNAPIDPGTGMAVPTIAVATAGGVSVILDSGSVVNSANTSSYTNVFIDASTNRLYTVNNTHGDIYTYGNIGSLGASFSGTVHTYGIGVPAVLSALNSASKIQANNTLVAHGATLGLGFLKENPTTPASGMVAYVTEKYNSGWQVGAIKGAYLADTTAETVTGSGELVTNGDFASDTAWTKGTGWVISGGVATHSGGTGGDLSQEFATVVGKTYVVTLTVTGTVGAAYLGNTPFYPAAGTYSYSVVSNSATLGIVISVGGVSATVDNISVKLAEPDRSVKNKALIVNGSLTKTAVASGAGLVAYSGFSAANYLEQPYNSDLDFGTGDFSVMGWVKPGATGAYQNLFTRANSGVTASAMAVQVVSDNSARFIVSDDGFATSDSVTSPAQSTDAWVFICAVRRGNYFELWINSAKAAADTAVANANSSLSNATATCRTGVAQNGANPALVSSLTLWRISATAPSADQIAQIYRDELPLFQPGAQCTLAGTSPAITALSYDEDTAVLHAGTSYGRSSFKGLLRIESEATTVGSPTSIASLGGHIVMGGTSAKLYTPAKYLRDELQRQSEAKKALGRIPVFLDFTATSGQTAFVATKGYRIQALYKGGTLMRESTTGTYWTRSHDGYQETATLSVGATTGDWISLMLVRN